MCLTVARGKTLVNALKEMNLPMDYIAPFGILEGKE